MYHVTLDDAKVRLADLVSAAANGEAGYIVAGGEQVVQLVPVKPAAPRPRFGSAAGLITMADGFESPLPDFREYMQ